MERDWDWEPVGTENIGKRVQLDASDEVRERLNEEPEGWDLGLAGQGA